MIININKPIGWTSFDIVKKARGILGTKKIGHAGTLDPLATGVLILLTDTDTKKQNEIMHYDKEYIAEVAFGGISDTYDLELPLNYSARIPLKDELVLPLTDSLTKYIGEFDQKAPAYSAKKVDGKRLYKLARSGTIFPEDIPTKRITIYESEIIEWSTRDFMGQDDEVRNLPLIKLRVRCSSGTYIRSLAHDIGEDLNCGGVLASLVRTRVGPYKINESKTLEDLKS